MPTRRPRRPRTPTHRNPPTGNPSTHEPAPPRSLGLTGGIGSGKSVALEAFRRLGAAVLSSDEVVHRIYDDPEVRAAVRERLGEGAFGRDGEVDRGALSRLAFAQPGGVAFLEGLVHPRVGRAREAWQAEQRRHDPPPPLMVCEVPLLFEAGLADAFDAVLVVSAPDEVRRARVEARGQDFSARSARQLDEAEKKRRADRYLVNDGSVADLEEWVAERFAEYTS